MSYTGPLCSVIIPTYNHGKYIERSISSALKQTLKDVEIIVVDDGSTDNTPDLVKKFGNSIHYIYKENTGLGNNRNVGINLSRGKYIQFLDADDTIDETKLEKQVDILERDKSIDLVYSDCSCNDLEGIDLENASYSLKTGENPLSVLLKRNISAVHACLIKRSVVIDVGMFDEARVAQEDWDLWLKIAIKGYKIKYVPGNLAHYDQRGSNMVIDPELMYKRTEYMLKKYLNDPEFNSLDKYIVKNFITYQSLSLATRAYNNRWWKQSRQHFLRAARANPKLMNVEFWACIPKTIVNQFFDSIKNPRKSA